MFFVVTECGDLSTLYSMMTEYCAEDLRQTGKDCQCSQQCQAAMSGLPQSCLTQVRDVMCMHSKHAREDQVELSSTVYDSTAALALHEMKS